MKKIDKLADQFLKEYQAAFKKAGNNLAVGYSPGGDIEVRLTNDKLKDTLPTEYHGVKVNVEVIGIVTAL